MAKPIKFKRPPKVKGRTMPSTHLKFDPIDKTIFKRRAQRASEASGMKVSIGNVLQTAYYQQYPEDRKESDRLKKEADNALKRPKRS
jgi:hypothetical protein